MRIGYARLSQDEQAAQLQLAALENASCGRIFVDYAPARAQLAKAVDYCQAGDTLVCAELARLAKSFKHLLQVVENLAARGADLWVLSHAINVDAATLQAFAQFERAIILQRTQPGWDAAYAAGKMGGRRKHDHSLWASAAKDRANGSTMRDIAAALGVSVATLYRWKDLYGQQQEVRH